MDSPALPVSIGPMRRDEIGFVAKATKKSLRDANFGDCSNFVAYARLNPLINGLLTQPETRVLVARQPNNPAEALGFIVFCIDESAMTVVFVYVKHERGYRRRGVARSLLSAVLAETPDTAELLYTFPSKRFDHVAERYGFYCEEGEESV